MSQDIEVSSPVRTSPFPDKWVVWAPPLHFIFSLALAVCMAFLIFAWWFPAPFRDLAGGAKLFWMLVGVDVVCGPLLTWVLFRPGKTRLALAVDLSLVIVIQLAALVYGLHTLSYARPLALVHEVDRFRVVTYADLPEAELKNAPDWVTPWGMYQERVFGVRSTRTVDEKLASVDASLQGVEPSQRPSWWLDYTQAVPQVLERAKPLMQLRQKHPGRAAVLDPIISDALAQAAEGETRDADALRWLPLVGRHSLSWVVIIDPSSGRLRGYVPLDGF